MLLALEVLFTYRYDARYFIFWKHINFLIMFRCWWQWSMTERIKITRRSLSHVINLQIPLASISGPDKTWTLGVLIKHHCSKSYQICIPLCIVFFVFCFCFLLLILSLFVDLWGFVTNIRQGCATGTGTIILLPPSIWVNDNPKRNTTKCDPCACCFVLLYVCYLFFV